MKFDIVTNVMKSISFLGGTEFLIVLSILFILLSITIKNNRYFVYILINLSFAASLNHFVKFLFKRPRPSGYNLITESGYSFPSGHSMVSMAYYGFLIYLILKHVKNKLLKFILCFILSFLIIFIGISRIYLGVHYASDVIAGFMLALSYLIIFISVINKAQ